MQEVTIQVVQPNVYIVGSQIYFGIGAEDLVPVSRSVDEIVKKHIGTLMVPKQAADILEVGDVREGTKQGDIFPLSDYLLALERKLKHFRYQGQYESNQQSTGILLPTHPFAERYGLQIAVDAETVEYSQITRWKERMGLIPHFDAQCDAYEHDKSFLKIDRPRTLESLQKVHTESEGIMPEYYAKFYVLRVKDTLLLESALVGEITFEQIKAKDKDHLELANKEILEMLKQTRGPQLSYEAKPLFDQAQRFFKASQTLQDSYGDILLDPDWQRRFFRIDP